MNLTVWNKRNGFEAEFTILFSHSDMIIAADSFDDGDGYMIQDTPSKSIEVTVWVKDADTKRIVYDSRETMTDRATEFLQSPIRYFGDVHRVMAIMFEAFLQVEEGGHM